MDAAQKLLKNSALLTAATLFLATAGLAQSTPTLNVTQTSVFLSGSAGQVVFTSSSAGSDNPITYSVSAPSYLDSDTGWLRAAANAPSITPGVIEFSLQQAPQNQGTHQATVTLTPSAPAGVAAVTITVTFTSGNGGGNSNLIATPNPVAISAPLNGFSTQSTVVISSNTSTTISSVTTALSSGTNVNWLSASIFNPTITPTSPGSIVVSGSAGSLPTGTYNGSVTVTPTSGAPLVVNVNFTVGSGGAGNWNVTTIQPMFYTTNGNFPDSQFIAVNAPANATSYGVSISDNTNGWLLVSANGQQTSTGISGIPPTTGFTLSASANITSLPQGVYNPRINLTDSNGNPYSATVTLTVNGGTSSGLSISPNSLTFNAALNSGQQSQSVVVQSNTGGTLTITGGVNPPTWLTTNPGPFPPSLAPGQQFAFTVFANPNGLSAATYSGNISITIGSQSGTLPVTLVVGGGGGGGGTGVTAIAPTSLTFSYQANTNPFFIAQQKLAITGPAGPWSSSISTNSSWLKLNPSSGSSLPNPAVSGDTPVVSIDPTGLTVGSYNGTITINTSGGSQTVTATLNVVAGVILLPTPGSLVFAAQTGQTNPAGQSIFFSGSDSTLNPLNITAVSNNTWITISTGATFVSVQVDPTGMATGVYTGTVTVSQTGAVNSPVQIPVVMVVNGGGGGGSNNPLFLTPSSLTFSASNGAITTANPQNVAVTANTSTSFVGSISYSPNNVGAWLTVNPLSGVTPANLTISANASGLSTGTYSATIAFNVNGVIQNLPVTLNVNTTGGTGGNVIVSPTSMTFSAQQGSNPAAQAFSVNSASGSAGIPFTVAVTSGSWLSTSAGATNTTPVNAITVNINTAGLLPATYNGNIQIAPTGGTTVNIPVTLTVTAPPTVSATPTSLTFDYRAGDAAPAAKQITVSGGGAALTFSATASSSGWLVASPASGTTPGTINVSINPSGLTTGNYNGTIVVSGTGSATGSTTVSVTLNVTAPLPTITKVTNAASYASGSLAPGEIITLFADDPTHPIGPATAVGLALDSSGKVATTIGGVQVLINGFACPMIYASASQVSAVVPYELKLFTTATVLVKFLGQTSNGVTVSMTTTLPGLFTANSSGTGPGAILNSNNSTNSANNPATRGDTVVVYLTGEGETSPGGTTGKVTTVASPPQPLTPGPLLPVSVTVGGVPANFSFAGEAPGFVSGVMQLNVITPTNVAAGPQNIVVTIGGNPSQQGVTVALR